MSSVVAAKERRIPGVEGVWVFVGADMFFFAVLFMSFMMERAKAVETFEASRLLLNQDIGGINTLILLTSSWLVVRGVQAAKVGDYDRVPRFLLGGLLFGVGFLVSKVFEYGAKFGAGITPISNDFFMFYFALTGIHLLHVIGGSVVLLVFYLRARGNRINADNVAHLEAGGIYWHMVDLLWIMLFPLLYLLKAL